MKNNFCDPVNEKAVGVKLLFLIEDIILKIDLIINTQINLFIHHTRFQKLEACWRGLFFLISQEKNNKNKLLKIKILPINENELTKDLTLTADFDQSQLFKKIVNDEFDRPGGEPYGLLINDFRFNHLSMIHIRILTALSQIATCAFTPIICNADLKLFGISNFSELKPYLNLSNIFIQQEYKAWNLLRQTHETRFLAMPLPDIIMRIPYYESRFNRYFTKEEVTTTNDYLWGSAAFYLAAAVINSFITTQWFYHIFDVNDEAPRDVFSEESYADSAKGICTVNLTEKQQQELNELGFTSLLEDRFAKKGVFYNFPSIHQRKFSNEPITDASNSISNMIPYILMVSRFGHTLKAIARDKVGSFLTAGECERFLQHWINQYCAMNSDMTPELLAKYPLREAHIKLNERIDKPGKYYCSIYLKPQIHIDEINAQLRLITTLSL